MFTPLSKKANESKNLNMPIPDPVIKGIPKTKSLGTELSNTIVSLELFDVCVCVHVPLDTIVSKSCVLNCVRTIDLAKPPCSARPKLEN